MAPIQASFAVRNSESKFGVDDVVDDLLLSLIVLLEWHVFESARLCRARANILVPLLLLPTLWRDDDND